MNSPLLKVQRRRSNPAFSGHLTETQQAGHAAVEKAARKPRGGWVVLNFSAILPRLEQVDAAAFSRSQLPVLTEFAERTAGVAGLADYHRYYRDNAAGMARFLERIG